MTKQEIFDHWATARWSGPASGSVWRHYKGMRYVVEGITLRESDREPLINYTEFDSPVVWTRPLSEWRESLEYKGETVQRFVPVDGRRLKE